MSSIVSTFSLAQFEHRVPNKNVEISQWNFLMDHVLDIWDENLFLSSIIMLPIILILNGPQPPKPGLDNPTQRSLHFSITTGRNPVLP